MGGRLQWPSNAFYHLWAMHIVSMGGIDGDLSTCSLLYWRRLPPQDALREIYKTQLNAGKACIYLYIYMVYSLPNIPCPANIPYSATTNDVYCLRGQTCRSLRSEFDWINQKAGKHTPEAIIQNYQGAVVCRQNDEYHRWHPFKCCLLDKATVNTSFSLPLPPQQR